MSGRVNSLQTAQFSSTRDVGRDAPDRRNVDAVVRVQAHRLRRARQVSPYLAGCALRRGYINKHIKGEPKLVVTQEALTASEFPIIWVRELTACHRELLAHGVPECKTLSHGAIMPEPVGDRLSN
jgi:hypothetical protein